MVVIGKVPGGSDLVPARWLQFTPQDIDLVKCMARTWANGIGGQCKRGAVEGGLCRAHAKETPLQHGRVDGDIPDQKFDEFMNKFAKRRSDSK